MARSKRSGHRRLHVIGRYLGETFGLAGSNALENFKLDGIADNFTDCIKEAAPKGMFELDAEKKQAIMKEFKEKSSKWFDAFENLVTSEGWISSNKLTWVDILFHCELALITAPIVYGSDLLEKSRYPKLTALIDRVAAQPNIAKWIAERPKTPM